MVSYEGLEQQLKEHGMTRSELGRQLAISPRTIAKIAKGEKLSSAVLERIAAYFSCAPEALFRVVTDNPVLQVLREEKAAKISGGLYHELQIRMTYNSNHLEGSRLTEDQTRLIFETNTVCTEDGVLVDDILETVHHFRAIDYVIDTADQPLTEAIIKHLHYLLKHDTRDAALPWFAVGDYKKRPNVVGGRDTAPPRYVPARIQKLLSGYEAIEQVRVEDIIAFHAEFELIHPFQDGNGRVGRLIALKECLRHNITPFLIEDSKKAFYYRGLSQWDEEKGYLIDTCLDGQDTFRRLLDRFDIPQSQT